MLSLTLISRLVYKKSSFFGSKSKNGSWIGMIGMIVAGEADVGLGDFTVSADRYAVIDFLSDSQFSR